MISYVAMRKKYWQISRNVEQYVKSVARGFSEQNGTEARLKAFGDEEDLSLTRSYTKNIMGIKK